MYLDVHLFDGNEKCVGKNYADKFYHIDFSNKERVLKIAKEINPIAILTIATELGNTTACYVSEKLGLKSNSYETALITTNKIKMKEHLKNTSNIFCKYEITKDSNNSKWNSFPCIVKPVDSSAGRGVSYVTSYNDLQQAIDEAKQYSSSSEVLIEEYIKGRQYSIETISSNASHKIITVVEEFITTPPTIIETQQLVPARIDNIKEQKINSFVLRVLELYNVKYGASHIEVRENENGELFLIEIATRMGGWRSELTRLALGINYCELLINSVQDKSIVFTRAYDKTAIVKMILNKEHLDEYLHYKKHYKQYLISDLEITSISDAKNLADSNGFYFVAVDDKKMVDEFIEKH
jgi:biotin carboxylase